MKSSLETVIDRLEAIRQRSDDQALQYASRGLYSTAAIAQATACGMKFAIKEVRDMIASEDAKDGIPMQPLAWDDDVIRFRANKIVRFLLDDGPFDMNQIAMKSFSNADHEQFAQLIGYSVSGFGDLSYASRKIVAAADKEASEMKKKRKRKLRRRTKERP